MNSPDPPVCAYRGCDRPATTRYVATETPGRRIAIHVCHRHTLPSDRSPPDQVTEDTTQTEPVDTLF